MNKLNSSKQNLIKEGLSSYFDALIAMREFQTVIQKQCQDIIRKHLDALSQAMGCNKGESNAIEDYIWPSNLMKMDSNEGIFLGARWRIPDVELKFEVGFSWWKEEDGRTQCHLHSAYDLCNKDIFDLLWDKFKAQRAGDWKGIEIGENISLDDQQDYIAKADKILSKWVELWKSAGTLNSIISKKSAE